MRHYTNQRNDSPEIMFKNLVRLIELR